MKEELSWIPLASWLEHNFRVETFGANSEDVSSGSSYDKLRGRFELCVVAAQAKLQAIQVGRGPQQKR